MHRSLAWMAAGCVFWGTASAQAADLIPPPRAIVLAPATTAAPSQASIVPEQIVPAPAAPTAPLVEAACNADKHAQAKSHFRQWLAQHRREPDGCPTPVGCGNAWTEFKFVFGSCRQFFGTGDASQGCANKTERPLPPYR